MDADLLELVRQICVQRGIAGAAADNLVTLVRPSLKLVTTAADDDAIDIGSTKMGGQAHVPKGFRWPRFSSQPLTFVGQVNLSEASAVLGPGLDPAEGVLSFFFDSTGDFFGTHDAGAAAVYRFSGQDLVRRSPPSELESGELNACTVELFAFPSLPYLSCRDSLFDLVFPGRMDLDLVDALCDLPYQLGKELLPTPYAGHHQLLGYPDGCQSEDHFVAALRRTTGVEVSGATDEERNAALQAAASWSLIMQLGDDPELAFDLGGGELSLLAPPGVNPADPPAHPMWIYDNT